MEISKETLEKSQIKLTITVTADEMLPYLEKAARRISENLDIPGFRKGQAPLDVVKQKAGEMALHQEAAQFAVEETLAKAIDQEHLHTVGQPEIGIDKLAPNNPFVYTATIPLLPEVTVGDLSKIKVEKESVSVTDDEVQKVIDNLLKMRGKEILVDREAKQGDKVEINFDVFLNKVPVEGGKGNKFPLTIGENTMIPGFEDNLVGMKKDEEKDFELKFPEEYHNKQLAGNNAEFKVKMLSVFEVELPELNDETLKELGEFTSADDLKEKIRENLSKEKEGSVDQKFEREIIEKLIDASTFGDLPDVLVTRESQLMMQELEQNVARQGLKFDDYLNHLKKDRKQLLLDFTPDAVKRIKSALLIKKVSEDQKIEATEEEVKEELDKMFHMYQGNEAITKQLDTASYRDYLSNMIKNRKTLHWIKEQV